MTPREIIKENTISSKQILAGILFVVLLTGGGILADILNRRAMEAVRPAKCECAITNVDDREGGICAAMYAEGFEWGLSQEKINWQTEHWQYPYRGIRTREEMAEAWYKHWEDIMKN